MRICPKCKTVIENDHAKFCKKCGYKLEPIQTKEQETTDTEHVKHGDPFIYRRDTDSGIILGSDTSFPSSKRIHNGTQNCHTRTCNQESLYRTHKKMTMANAIKTCFSKYVKFEGKASRSEYWYFGLFSFCMVTLPIVLAFIIDKDMISLSLSGVSLLYSIVSFLPMLSVTIRRLHDAGKSETCLLYIFIPFVGGLILLYLLCKKGNEPLYRA